MPDENKKSTRTFDFDIDTVTLSLDGAGQVAEATCTCALWNGWGRFDRSDCVHIKKAKFSYANPDATPDAVNAVVPPAIEPFRVTQLRLLHAALVALREGDTEKAEAGIVSAIAKL